MSSKLLAYGVISLFCLGLIKGAEVQKEKKFGTFNTVTCVILSPLCLGAITGVYLGKH